MLKKAMPLIFGVLACASAFAARPERPPPAPAVPTIVDATGAGVGAVVPSVGAEVAAVYRTSTERIKVTFIGWTGVLYARAVGMPYLYFDSPECLGNAYLPANEASGGFLHEEYAGYTQAFVYHYRDAQMILVRPDLTGTVGLSFASRLQPNGYCELNYSGGPILAYPTTTEAFPFNEPFRVN